MKAAVIVVVTVALLAFAAWSASIAPLSTPPLAAASAVVVVGLATIAAGLRQRRPARAAEAVAPPTEVDAELTEAKAEVEALLRDRP